MKWCWQTSKSEDTWYLMSQDGLCLQFFYFSFSCYFFYMSLTLTGGYIYQTKWHPAITTFLIQLLCKSSLLKDFLKIATFQSTIHFEQHLTINNQPSWAYWFKWDILATNCSQKKHKHTKFSIFQQGHLFRSSISQVCLFSKTDCVRFILICGNFL